MMYGSYSIFILCIIFIYKLMVWSPLQTVYLGYLWTVYISDMYINIQIMGSNDCASVHVAVVMAEKTVYTYVD